MTSPGRMSPLPASASPCNDPAVPDGNLEHVLLVTTDGVPGRDIIEVLGFVAGLSSDRERALGVLVEEARKLGADAVVAVRVDSSASGGAFVADNQAFAYGTAVRTNTAA